MAKLSHIADVEQRAYEEQAARQQAAQGARQAAQQGCQPEDGIPQQDAEMTSEQEEEFHGLDATQPMGTGHKALIILAVVVVVVAVLYIVNSWIHFI